MSIKKALVLTATGLILLDGAATPLMACSVCRCGDNIFQFTNQDLPLAEQGDPRYFQLSIGTSFSSKSNDLAPDEGIGTEEQDDYRPWIRGVYSLADNFSVSAELPLTIRRLTVNLDEIERVESSGIGDAELAFQWMSNLSSANGRFMSGGLTLGVKLPTGTNDKEENGQRIEEHMQSGTGTVDVMVGGAFARSTCNSRMFVSAYHRLNGTNGFDYHYGDATLYNIGAQRSLSPTLVASLQLNGRHALRDKEETELLENTGGSVAYLTPGLRFGIGAITSLSISVQVPIWEDLYGVQDEKAVFLTGLSFNL